MFEVADEKGLNRRLAIVIVLLGILVATAALVSGGSIFRDTQAAFLAAVMAVFLIVAATGIPIRLTLAHKAFFIFLIIALVAVVSSVWVVESLQEIGLIVGYLIIFVLMSNIAGEKRYRLAAHMIVLAGVVVAAVGIYQYFITNVAQLKSLESMGHDMLARQLASMINRAFGSFSSANGFAGYLILIIPVAIGLLIYERDIRLRVWLGLALATISAAEYFAFSKGSLLALALALGVIIIGGLLKTGRSKKAPLVLLFGLAAGTPLYILWTFFSGRISAVATNIGGRVELWRGAWQLIIKRPILGSGPGTFGTEITQHQVGSVYSPYAHNTYLQMGAEIGLVGLAAFITAMVIILVFAWKRFRDSRLEGQVADKGREISRDAWLRLGLIASLVGFLAHNFVDYTWYMPGVALTFWFIAGLAVGPVSDLLPTAKKPTGPRYALITIVALSLIPVLFVFAGEKYNVAGDNLREAYELKKAKKFYEESLQLFPYNARAHDGLAQTLYAEALAANEKLGPEVAGQELLAVKLRPSWAFYEARAGDYLGQQGQDKAALRHYQKAIALNPLEPKIRVKLGNFLYREGRFKEALAVFGSATDLGEIYGASRHTAAAIARARQDINGPLTSIAIAYMGEARTNIALHEYQAALVSIEKNEAMVDDNLETLYLRAQILEKQGSYKKAAAIYKRVVDEMTIFNPKVPFRLAKSLELSGQVDAAVEELEEILKKAPTYKPASRLRKRLLMLNPGSKT